MPIITQNSKVLTAAGKVLIREPSPLDLPNLKLYLSATRMPQYADGTAIPSFLDYSGNNYNATQANTSLQPTFQTNEFGTNSGIKGDGTNDIMSLNGAALNILRNINQYTVQIAFKRTILGDVNILLQYTNGNNTFSRLTFSLSATSISTTVRNSTNSQNLIINSNDLNPHLVQLTLNPSNQTFYMYLDGVLMTTGVADSAYTEDLPSVSGVIFGSNLSNIFGEAVINGITINQAYSDHSIIQQQYKGWLNRGWL